MKELTPARVLRYGLILTGVLTFVAALFLWLSPNATLLQGFSVFLLLLLLLVSVLIYRKLVINFMDARTETRNAAAQQQALLYLFQKIEPRRALPQMRSYAASPDFLCLLYDLIREHKPHVVVECGGGVSTLISGYALEQNGSGRVLALEHDARYAAATEREIQRHGLQQRASVLHAPLTEAAVGEYRIPWYDLRGLPEELRIDLLVVDGPPSTLHELARYPAFPLLRERLSEQAVILADDCIRPAERRMVEMWAKEMPGLTIQWVMTEKRAAVLVV
ncbi:MAG TPA: class I SAM-dependent methyltransferase [Phaeodactylibacter sp.]|nr:class I SAM-dependent methyltransferase [Phaeodactylibacter sp.]